MSQQSTTVQPAIPFKRDSDDVGAALASSGIGVLLVSLIAIGAVLVARRRLALGAPGAGGKAMLQVLESRRLGPRALVSVVEFKGRHYLLAQSEQGVTCIDSVPAGEEA